MRHVAFVAVAFVLGCSGDEDAPAQPIDRMCTADPGEHIGEATYYTYADGSGACMFDPSPEDLMIGAMNQADFLGSEACGACVSLEGPKGTIRIRIVDLCANCPQGNIDLSRQAFEQIAELSAGRVPIRWRYVSCPLTTPIRYHFKDGSNQWWTAVQIRNHVNRIGRLEALVDGNWSRIPRLAYNYFVAESGLGPGPYTFRVTDAYSQSVEDTGIPHRENADVAATSQFPACTGP